MRSVVNGLKHEKLLARSNLLIETFFTMLCETQVEALFMPGKYYKIYKFSDCNRNGKIYSSVVELNVHVRTPSIIYC